MKRRRPAFTLIEMLLVIFVIGLLIALVTIVTSSVTERARVRQSRMGMETAQSMLEAMRLANNLKTLPVGYVPLTGSVMENQPGRTGTAAANTSAAFKQLRTLPANQSAFDKLPGNQVGQLKSATITLDLVILDAWGNPIIYVPKPNFSESSWNKCYGLMTSSGRVVLGGDWPTNKPASTEILLEFKPFFVSAGPDGNLDTHEDNIYSQHVSVSTN